MPAPERRHRGSQFAWLGCSAVVGLGLTLVLYGGAPSQAGTKLTPVAVPAHGSGAATSPGSSASQGSGCGDPPGVPVAITVDGARAQNTPVEPHGLGDDGRLYVPEDPAVASWLDYPDVGPGADHGSAVLTTHVNYGHVVGAFGDLTTYRPGQHISVTLADGRVLSYRVVPAATMGFRTTDTALVVQKDQLDQDPELRAQIFDFTSTWSDEGGPSCGRLVLVTCTGQVVHHNYVDNAFVFAVPDP